MRNKEVKMKKLLEIVLVASVDPDRGYVFDFGFIRRAG